jgi:haloacid dehalogenase superfamily, subfamily IA, variant 3 with third motif having DD or ED
MDGLLIDTEGMYYQSRKEILAKYGFPFTKEENMHYIAKGFEDTNLRLQKLTGDKKLGKVIFEESMQRYHDKVLAGHLDLKPGAVELLKYLQAKDIDRYVTSSATQDIIKINAEHARIKDYFTGFISGDDVPNNKPAPDIYLHALKVTNTNPDEAVIFEDAESGIEAAESAGIDVVVVPDLVQPRAELTNKATAALNNLNEAIELF